MGLVVAYETHVQHYEQLTHAFKPPHLRGVLSTTLHLSTRLETPPPMLCNKATDFSQFGII